MVKMLNFVMHILLQLKNWKKQQISKKKTLTMAKNINES